MKYSSPHLWLGLSLAILIIGFVLHQLGARIGMLGQVVKASYGS